MRAKRKESPEYIDITKAVNGDSEAVIKLIKYYEPLAYFITRSDVRKLACKKGVCIDLYSEEDLRQEIILRFMHAVSLFDCNI